MDAYEKFEEETGLVLDIIADTTIRELMVYLDREVPDSQVFSYLEGNVIDLSVTLSEKAAEIYQNDRGFASRMKHPDGRDHLYMFMRHWLTGSIQNELGFAGRNELPAGFSNGVEPPYAPVVPSRKL